MRPGCLLTGKAGWLRRLPPHQPGLGLLQSPADHRRHAHTVDVLQAVEVLDAEGTGPGERDPHGLSLLGRRFDGLEHEVADRRIGTWNVVETVQFLG